MAPPSGRRHPWPPGLPARPMLLTSVTPQLELSSTRGRSDRGPDPEPGDDIGWVVDA
jgi:hypothetical protein